MCACLFRSRISILAVCLGLMLSVSTQQARAHELTHHVSVTDSATETARVAFDDNPFDWLESVPHQVDAAAVLNNPAENILLNDSGRSIRKILALAGVFTQTENAWETLAREFGQDTDQTIRQLLGRRVVVLWDSNNTTTSSSPLSTAGFIQAIDTNWAIICEVEQSYLKEIQKHLTPVKRRLERGHTVYAIEKGRFEIVLLAEDPSTHRGARVLLAPKKGTKLLDRVIESMTKESVHNHTTRTPRKENHRTPSADHSHQSILSCREELIAQVSTKDIPWSVAWVAQLDRFAHLSNQQSTDTNSKYNNKYNNQSNGQQNSTCRALPTSVVGVMHFDDTGFDIQFSSDIALNLPQQDAPVELLSAAGSDAILAAAVAQTPDIFVEQRSIHTMYQGVFDHPTKPADTQPADSGFPKGPGFIMLANHEQGKACVSQSDLAMTVYAEFHDRDLEQNQNHPALAARVDQLIQNLYSSYDPISAPRYQGRFPQAIRTHTIESVSSDQAITAWPGQQARLSWIARDASEHPALIASITPQSSDSGAQVQWISRALRNLDSIEEQVKDVGLTPQQGVITKGYFRPALAISLLNTQDPIDLSISKLIGRIQWEISRAQARAQAGAQSGVQGQLRLDFLDLNNRSILGFD